MVDDQPLGRALSPSGWDAVVTSDLLPLFRSGQPKRRGSARSARPGTRRSVPQVGPILQATVARPEPPQDRPNLVAVRSVERFQRHNLLAQGQTRKNW